MRTIIVAYDRNRGIGLNKDLPWELASDLRWVSAFTRKVTDSRKRNAVLMGRKTWESIPPKRRPLRGRLNIVLSRTPATSSGDVLYFHDLMDAIDFAGRSETIENVFIFGGADIFRQALALDVVDRIIATEIDASFDADTFFPPIPPRFGIQDVETVSGERYGIKRVTYVRTP